VCGLRLASGLDALRPKRTGPPISALRALRRDWRQNKLTSSEYDETTCDLGSVRTWLSFVSQRLSVATQLAAAQEVAEALGLSVAAEPRLL
jgi:hypothetical protein